jgi:hypothetical protein
VWLVFDIPVLHEYDVGVDGSRIAQLAVSRFAVPPLQFVVPPQAVLLALVPVVT